MNRRWKRWVLAVCASMIVVALAVLLRLPPRTGCDRVPRGEKGEHWFQATETVVQPWLGRHHVYGIFTIPNTYKFDHLYTAKLKIQGIHDELQAGSPEHADMSSSTWESGSYRKRVYLSTRVTLLFLVIGRFGDLKIPCQWWLVIKDRVA